MARRCWRRRRVGDAGGMQVVSGYLMLLGAAVANGSFGILHKFCDVENSLFVVYFCIGAFIVSEATILLLLATGQEIAFSPFGFPSGFAQFFAINCVFFTMRLAGVAVSMVGFAGGIILASALVEQLLVLHIAPTDPAMFVLAIVVVCVGLAGVFVSRRMSDALSQARTQGGHKELSPAASQETAVASFIHISLTQSRRGHLRRGCLRITPAMRSEVAPPWTPASAWTASQPPPTPLRGWGLQAASSFWAFSV